MQYQKTLLLRRKIVGVLCSGLAAASTLVVAGQSPAGAVGVAGGTFAGAGTISPGLTTTPTFQTFTLTTSGPIGLPSTMAAVTTSGGVAAGTINCAFSGSSTIAETIAAGIAAGAGTCSGGGTIGTTSITCTIRTFRVGVYYDILFSCTIYVNGIPTGVTEVAIYLWLPGTFNPTTSFQLVGWTAGVAAS
jgi:hypothetical protein